MRYILLVSSLFSLITWSNAQFTKLQWSDCGSPQVQFFDIAIKPMPILQPGQAELKFFANLLRRTHGNLRTELNIIRTVSGLALPLRWFLLLFEISEFIS